MRVLCIFPNFIVAVVHKHEWIDRLRGRSCILLRQYPVSDLADHFRRQFHSVKILYLIVDVPCAHTSCIKGEYFFFYAGDIPLVFRDEFWFELTFPVPWDIDLEFPILALQCFRGVTVSLIGCLDIPFLILFITERCVQFCFHEFLQDILKAVSEQAVNVGYAV